MILYLMRHGKAVSADEWPGAEKARPLAPRGEKELKSAAAEWVRLNFSPQTLLTSPLTRAQQTAAYLQKPSPIVVPELEAGVKPDVLRTVFLQRQWKWPLLYVGHMPDLAFFSSRLTQNADLLEASIDTGEMLAFETGPWQTKWGTGQLLWRRRLDDWKKAKEI